MNEITTNPDEKKQTTVIGREQLRDAGFLREQWQNIRLIWRLVRDPEVPFYLKFIPFAAVAYLFLPIDLIPDVLLGFGQMDDLALLMVGAKTFTTFAPQHIVAAHLEQIRREDGYLPEKQLTEAIVIEGEKKN